MELAAHDLMNEITSWIHGNMDKLIDGLNQTSISSIQSQDGNPK